jgi:hypothetical protein
VADRAAVVADRSPDFERALALLADRAEVVAHLTTAFAQDPATLHRPKALREVVEGPMAALLKGSMAALAPDPATLHRAKALREVVEGPMAALLEGPMAAFLEGSMAAVAAEPREVKQPCPGLEPPVAPLRRKSKCIRRSHNSLHSRRWFFPLPQESQLSPDPQSQSQRERERETQTDLVQQ